MTTPQQHWAADAFFYHIYPLGFCGAPDRNDLFSPPVNRLQKVTEWLPHMRSLGVNALYLGPLFEASRHGYDTADYYTVDRRLGDHDSLKQLAQAVHQNGMHLILDAVFNHVGRDFWAFRDVQQNLSASRYCSWFSGLRFDTRSPKGDPFTYDTWSGYFDLVKLNLDNPEVRGHLFEAVRMWINEFGIDGLRLDAADCLSQGFLQALHDFCKQVKPDFWLMGEVIHGDYRKWVNPGMLDSVTNYECYKALYSSLNEKNYFEAAYALNRQFGREGMYRGMPLYNFADNHDVDRVASKLNNPAHLYPLYLLLFTMPGVPSMYYGSEWGIQGRRTGGSDAALRPCLILDKLQRTSHQPDLPGVVAKLASLQAAHPVFRLGDYQQVLVAPLQYAFLRQTDGECVLVILNADEKEVQLTLSIPHPDGKATDILNGSGQFQVKGGKIESLSLPPCWGRVLKIT